MTEKINALSNQGITRVAGFSERRLKPDATSNIVEGFTERRRQAILLKSGALQSALLHSTNILSIATDANGLIQIFNVGAERMLGYAASDLINKITPADIYDPQQLIAHAQTLSAELGTTITPGFEALVYKASRGIEDIHELTYIRQDGTRFPAAVSVTALRDEPGNIIGYLLMGTGNTVSKQAQEALLQLRGRLPQRHAEQERWIDTRWSVEPGPEGERQTSLATHLDITERKQVETALRQSEERFRAAVGIVSSLIWTNNADGLMEGEQLGWSSFTGQTQDEYQGYGWSNAVHPEDAQPTIDAWRQAVAEKRIFEFVHRIRRRDGEWRSCSIRALPLLRGDGKIREWVGVHTDITERKQAEDALRQSEEFSRSIINSSPDCIKVLDLEGNLLSMLTGQELLGIEDIRPFLNTSWLDFWKDEDRQAAQAALAAARVGEVGKFVGFFRTLRDEPKWWDVNISAIFDANGSPSSLLAVSRDITSRKRAEMNLEFLASVSEDLVMSTNMEEMTRTVGAKLAAYLNLSLCAFVEIDETAEQVTISYDWHREDVPGLVGVYRLADFVGEEFLRAARAGEIVVVRDTAMDPRTNPEGFAPLKIASFISVPLIRDGQWRFALCLYHSTPYDWREDEVELMRELTTRIWTRLERLQAEKALRESEQRYRSLFLSMDEGYCVIEIFFDEHEKPVDWRYLEVNPAFEKQNGMHDVVHKRISEIAPDLEEYWFEIYGKVALTGEPIRYVNETKSLGGRWFSLYAFRVGGPDSRKVAVLFTDITGSKRAEQALRESEERYRTLFSSIDEAFCVIEMIFDELEQPVDYRFLEVNPTFERQTGMHEATGKLMRELAPNLEQHWFEIYGKVALTGEPIRFVNEAKPMDGRWFDVYACRVGEPESRKVAIIFNDITKRRQDELNLKHATSIAEKANLAKSDFLSKMSHELRTPLNAILGFAQLLEAASPPPTAIQTKRLGQIIKAGWYLLDLINEILDLAAIESGKLALSPTAVSLAEAMTECHTMTESQAQKHDVQINFAPIDPTWLIHADRTRLTQVVLNLLSNAIKYNRKHGTVEVTCIATAGRIRINIKDSGEGLPPEKLAHLFQAFNRLGQEHSSQEGTGIGLVVTKQLVELMEGTIGVTSTVGVGSEFWIELPHHMPPQLHSEAGRSDF